MQTEYRNVPENVTLKNKCYLMNFFLRRADRNFNLFPNKSNLPFRREQGQAITTRLDLALDKKLGQRHNFTPMPSWLAHLTCCCVYSCTVYKPVRPVDQDVVRYLDRWGSRRSAKGSDSMAWMREGQTGQLVQCPWHKSLRKFATSPATQAARHEKEDAISRKSINTVPLWASNFCRPFCGPKNLGAPVVQLMGNPWRGRKRHL